MKIRILLLSACGVFFTVNAMANLRPVVSLAAGTDYIGFNMNQNVTTIAPFQNTYNSDIEIFDFTGGLFLGVESTLWNAVSGQLGVSYYQNANYEVQGRVWQFGEPALNDMRYQYYIQSQRAFLEGKLLTAYQDKYHPFFTAGIGAARNHAYNYNEKSMESTGVPMVPGYGDHSKNSFAWLVGAGVDMDITTHTRLGVMYRYSKLGNARLNPSPINEGTQTLKNNSLSANELFLQLTYLG